MTGNIPYQSLLKMFLAERAEKEIGASTNRFISRKKIMGPLKRYS
jgi:hypothetical protein